MPNKVIDLHAQPHVSCMEAWEAWKAWGRQSFFACLVWDARPIGLQWLGPDGIEIAQPAATGREIQSAKIPCMYLSAQPGRVPWELGTVKFVSIDR